MSVELLIKSSCLANLSLSKAGSLKKTNDLPTAVERPCAGLGMLSSFVRWSRSFWALTFRSSMCFRLATVAGCAMIL